MDDRWHGAGRGAGLYWLVLGVTFIILIAQTMLHRSYPWLASPKTEQLDLRLANKPGVIEQLEQLLEAQHITIVRAQVEKGDAQWVIELHVQVRLPSGYNRLPLLRLVQEHPAVQAVEVQ